MNGNIYKMAKLINYKNRNIEGSRKVKLRQKKKC